MMAPFSSTGRRSLVGCSPWGREESDTTERLLFDFSLSCIGEGSGTPLQYSCLENPHGQRSLAKSLQSCPTLCDPTDGSPPGFPVPGILQSKTLEWVAISFSNA